MLHFVQHMSRPGAVTILPPGWREIPGNGPVADVSRTYVSAGGLRVIASVDLLDDGTFWDHLSVSRPDRLPSWDDLVLCKETFIGLEREALQLFPLRSEYVNLCRHCLHIWARLAKKRMVLGEVAA